MTARLHQDPVPQERVLAFLGAAATHGGAPVHRIDTHASVVFLAGNRALKIKRALRLPFLDYSTLEKRKAACEEELKINRFYAPEIYRRVVPITEEGNGGLKIGEGGTPVEWALEMVRFDENQTFDNIALAGPLDPDLATEIADAIVRSHQGAAHAIKSPWPASIRTLIARNTAKFRSAALPTDEIDRLNARSLSTFAKVQTRLERRSADGFVRRCHGDLHLANIALIDRHPVLFDAIEFDPAIATTDILYDIAFTLMDLVRFEQYAAANLVLNRYLSRMSEDNIDGLAALPLFMSIRAAIRAHVLFTRYEQTPDAKTIRDARRYFQLANDLIAPAAPELIAVGGLSGTGKSVLARSLASEMLPRPGAVILRSDVIRKRMFNVEDTAPLPPAAYQPSVSESVYRTLAEAAARILEQGCSVVADAAYLRETERAAIRKIAVSKGLLFRGLFLKADLATRLTRINARKNDASDANAEVARQQEQYNLGALDWLSIDASGTSQQTLQKSVAQLHKA